MTVLRMPRVKSRFARGSVARRGKAASAYPAALTANELERRKLNACTVLEAQLQSKLELSCVVGRRGPAEVAAVT